MLSVCRLSLRRFCETDHTVAVAQSLLRLGNIFRLTYVQKFFGDFKMCLGAALFFFLYISVS